MHVVHALENEKPVERRRRFPRFEVQCRAKIRIGKRYYAGYIHNISEAGAKLRTISSIRRIGAVILQLPDLPAMHCKLTWTNAYHAGVLFDRPLTSNELQRWMARRRTFKQLNPGLEAHCELVELADDAAQHISGFEAGPVGYSAVLT
jgi:carotenoid cleavage dioxygenase-like enzyme